MAVRPGKVKNKNKSKKPKGIKKHGPPEKKGISKARRKQFKRLMDDQEGDDGIPTSIQLLPDSKHKKIELVTESNSSAPKFGFNALSEE
jgi:hypothetical protein